jgi:hypothetical protein
VVGQECFGLLDGAWERSHLARPGTVAEAGHIVALDVDHGMAGGVRVRAVALLLELQPEWFAGLLQEVQELLNLKR